MFLKTGKRRYYLLIIILMIMSFYLMGAVATVNDTCEIRSTSSSFLLENDLLKEHIWNGISQMISEIGLPYDNLRFSAKGSIIGIEAHTSPSNIAVYLGSIVAMRDEGIITNQQAKEFTLETLSTLNGLDKSDYGQPYNWYQADEGVPLPCREHTVINPEGEVIQLQDCFYVSSVDNGNLIIVLEGLKSAFSENSGILQKVTSILQPMQEGFKDAFYDADIEAIRLGYATDLPEEGRFHYNSPYHYSNLGSEARAPIALLEAKQYLPEGSFQNLHIDYAELQAEEAEIKIFKTFDGGTFQYLLPNILLGEINITEAFATIHNSFISIMTDRGRDSLPAAYSACSGVKDGEEKYIGNAGLTELATTCTEVIDYFLTPHAIYLMESVNEDEFQKALHNLLSKYEALFIEGVGFRDSINLNTSEISEKVLILNQGMSLMSGSNFGNYVQESINSLQNVYSTSPLSPYHYHSMVDSSNLPQSLMLQEEGFFQLTVENTGFTTWRNTDKIRLGAVGDYDHLVPLEYWRVGLDHDVGPGQKHTFSIPVYPEETGTFTTEWRMLKEGEFWFGEKFRQEVEVSVRTDVEKTLWQLFK